MPNDALFHAIELGGARFRDKGTDRSDFDVSLSGQRLFDDAAAGFPGMAKDGRIGPLKPADMNELGIDVGRIDGVAGRDTRYMILKDQIQLYRRGPGFPLVSR
jgi:hypothetical protein